VTEIAVTAHNSLVVAAAETGKTEAVSLRSGRARSISMVLSVDKTAIPQVRWFEDPHWGDGQVLAAAPAASDW
jgi:hypothetical protein